MADRYREQAPPADLAPWVRCGWVSRPAADDDGLVVPDGCLDLMWIEGRLVVAGPDEHPFRPEGRRRERPVTVTGVRFRPGRAGALLGESPAQLRNQRVDLADVGRPALDGLEERLAAASSGAETLALLTDEVRARADRAPDPDTVAAGAADLIQASGGRVTVGAVAGELGVSERNLRRRATEALGYGPKTFARIVRFQGALALLRRGDRSLSTVAAEAGYADQAHLTREMTELAGETPGAIVAVSFKTAGATPS